MLREKILDEATLLGLKISQSHLGKWIVESVENNKEWFLLLEGELDEWTIISNGVSEISLDSKSMLKVLKELVSKGY